MEKNKIRSQKAIENKLTLVQQNLHLVISSCESLKADIILMQQYERASEIKVIEKLLKKAQSEFNEIVEKTTHNNA